MPCELQWKIIFLKNPSSIFKINHHPFSAIVDFTTAARPRALTVRNYLSLSLLLLVHIIKIKYNAHKWHKIN